jgi:uncharacterized protein (DUF4213/DUF364 family)
MDELPLPGTPAADALANLVVPECSAIGLATANALANHPPTESHRTNHVDACPAQSWWAQAAEGDLLDVLELRPDDHVGMVGHFEPLVGPIRRRVRKLSVFERNQRLGPGLISGDRVAEFLPRCSVALITATALMNGTIEDLLTAAADCREVVVLGPSTPLVPEAFAASSSCVTLLAGVIVMHADELLRTVADGGGTRDFKASVTKVNVRVNARGEHSPVRDR